MTTVSEPRTDDPIDRARRLAQAAGKLPSKRTLMRELRVGLPRAETVLEQLVAEQAQRRREGRRRLQQLRSKVSQPRPRRAVPARFQVAPVMPVVRAAGPLPVIVSPQATPAVEAAGRTPVVDERPVSKVRPKRAATWPVLLLAAPAFVSIWSGWVDLGRLTGFGVVHPLPGIWDAARLNTAITLPIGLETYAAYALWVWLAGAAPVRARRFARASAIGSLVLGAAGQVAYHLMAAAGVTSAPWQITTIVACLPVAVLGMGAALAHLVKSES